MGGAFRVWELGGAGRAGGRGAGRLVADSVAYTDEYVSAWIDGVVLTR